MSNNRIVFPDEMKEKLAQIEFPNEVIRNIAKQVSKYY